MIFLLVLSLLAQAENPESPETPQAEEAACTPWQQPGPHELHHVQDLLFGTSFAVVRTGTKNAFLTNYTSGIPKDQLPPEGQWAVAFSINGHPALMPTSMLGMKDGRSATINPSANWPAHADLDGDGVDDGHIYFVLPDSNITLTGICLTDVITMHFIKTGDYVFPEQPGHPKHFLNDVVFTKTCTHVKEKFPGMTTVGDWECVLQE